MQCTDEALLPSYLISSYKRCNWSRSNIFLLWIGSTITLCGLNFCHKLKEVYPSILLTVFSLSNFPSMCYTLLWLQHLYFLLCISIFLNCIFTSPFLESLFALAFLHLKCSFCRCCHITSIELYLCIQPQQQPLNIVKG